MAKPDLTQVYEALRAAEANQNKEDVAKLIEYIQSVENEPEGKTYDPRDQVPLLTAAGAGAVAGSFGVPLIQAGINKVEQARGKFPEMTAVHPNEMVPKTSAIDEALNKGFSNAITQHTREAQISQREKNVAKTLAELKAKGVPVSPNILADMQTQAAMPGGSILINADTAKKIEAEEAARKTAASPKKPLPQRVISGWEAPKLPSNILGNVGHFLQGVSEYKLPLIGSVGPLASHILGGAATFTQAADAYNRSLQNDPRGTLISGIGAAGTGVATLPFPPPFRAVGAGVGLSAEAINAYRDAMRKGRIEHGAPESYENINPAGDTYAQGGLAHLAEGGQPPKPNANEGGAFIGYPQINKNRKIGSGTGFLDALVGAPPSRQNILNPSDYSYMQGYEKGEPYGIASMALPFVGAAAKPLAKEIGTRAFMGESLTPKMMRGLMPEASRLNLEAWHGTPHNIQGKFDLSKVGTGEGAQSYGHGMYFAQNPSVAKEYQRKLSGWDTGTKLALGHHGGIDNAIVETEKRINSYKSGNWSENEKERASRLLQLNQKKLEELQAIKSGAPEPIGNLYKVDVPDEHIPKMLDWDKKLSDQPHIWNSLDQNIKDAIDELMERNHANPMSESLYDYTGEHLYKALKHPDVHDTLPAEVPNSNWYKGDTTNEKHTSQFLNSLGIPGIKYLDQGSRQNIPKIRLVTDIDGMPKYEVNPGYNKDKTTLQLAKKKYFDTREEALDHADSFGTKNFVSFKPEEVKILERNNEPIGPLSNLE